jgi:aminoglycoside phosphotransferase (APT) family kinase protein
MITGQTIGPRADLSRPSANFTTFLVAPVKNCPRPERAAEYRKGLPDNHDIIFAHADISWENILVDRATGDITGILDWEMAGFWPEWWDYRKALYGARSQAWWIDILKKTMPEYPSETDTDMDLEMY